MQIGGFFRSTLHLKIYTYKKENSVQIWTAFKLLISHWNVYVLSFLFKKFDVTNGVRIVFRRFNVVSIDKKTFQ